MFTNCGFTPVCSLEPTPSTCAVVGGMAQCVSGPACTQGHVLSTCNGSVVVSCTGGHTGTFDCASIGLTCVAGTEGAGCTGTADECDDTTPESCTDGVISFCLNGTKTTLDCTSYGLSGCKTVPAGDANPFPSVQCTP
jgi:hypothetical protein